MGRWTRIGSDGNRGIVPEGLSLSANEAGPDTCSFTLRRVAHLPWPDLLAFNQCEVWIGGTLVWGGRIWEAPLSDAEEDVIAVQGRGWQYHLDDDLLSRYYVHTRLSDWRDSRSFPDTDWPTIGALGGGGGRRGAITLAFPSGSGVHGRLRLRRRHARSGSGADGQAHRPGLHDRRQRGAPSSSTCARTAWRTRG